LVPPVTKRREPAYSRRNRSAAISIPMYSASPKAKSLEFGRRILPPILTWRRGHADGRFGLASSIKIDPGEPLEKDIYDIQPRGNEDRFSMGAPDLRSLD
jgi:glutamine synthetase